MDGRLPKMCEEMYIYLICYEKLSCRLDGRLLKMYEEKLGIERVKVQAKQDKVKARQDKVKARQDKVKARQDKVKLWGLEVLYNNLRQDLFDAREMSDSNNIKMIKEEMQKLQKQR